ncbi:hypothetical protein [Planobispora takensis]|uniref:hypothetical protein n=1 Tax=Planobispora takensis TaxID=1367882 RepID=UPI001941E3A6|nr:hypothetical protein [Planobispora takensis]
MRRLRTALYANGLLQTIGLLRLPSPWWVDVAWALGWLALVVLFHGVLGGASRTLRIVLLVSGTVGAAGSLGEEVSEALDARFAARFFDAVELQGWPWLLWLTLILFAQARDGRWGRIAVWSGAASVAAPFVVVLLRSGVVSVSVSDIAYFHGYVLMPLTAISEALQLVWLARSAHDLASSPARAVPRREPRPVRFRLPSGRWLLTVTATVVPLLALPAADHARGPFTSRDDCPRAQSATGEYIPASTLDEICLRAAADAMVGIAEEEGQVLAMQVEEQRKCNAVPRHRPLITPESVSVIRKPIWPETGLEAYEDTPTGSDAFDNGLYDLVAENGLVAALPGHMVISTDSEFRICVTLETYARRPPVETEGWHHVVEVGYRSPTGEIVIRDPMSGTVLPDLAFRGAGDYRIRVHHAWFPWKGEKYGTQRLLIMVYPGRGDDVVVHRAKTGP